MTSHPLRPESLCAAAREDRPTANRPVSAPIYQTAAWSLDSLEQCEAVYSGEAHGYIYTREANPNHAALERVIAALEGVDGGGTECVVFGSGMAAIAGAVAGLTRGGGRILAARQVYGTSTRLLSEELSRFGVTVDWVDVLDHPAIETSLAVGADLLLVETLANPLLQLADIPVLAGMCRRHGAKLVVDNTFASPHCCRPLELGADVVVHSVTKFLGGHSDLTLGAACGSPELMAILRREARLWGGSANPFEAWLALRGIATYPLRIQRSCANAAELAGRLEAHPRVRRVWHPSLASHPQHARCRTVLRDFGAMLAFDCESGEAARHVLSALRLVRFVPSLGDVATTISYPAATSQRGQPEEALRATGISAATLRLSVGIDHVEDVWADLLQALG